VLSKYPESVKLVIKHFPLRRIHPFADKAARAALAAGRQGKFWEFHHLLFKNHQSLSDGKIAEIAKTLALDLTRFRQDMASGDVRRIVEEDTRQGYDIGVRGTPTIYINGKLLPSENRSLEGMSTIIDKELKRGKGGATGQ